MAAEYDFLRRPNPKGDGELQPLYPCIVNKGTIDTKRLISDISTMSSFSDGDIAGLLTAFEERISYYLSEGHHVQLGNIGYFSASLRARPVMDKKEIHSQNIYFGKVHFRVSPRFRKKCAGFVERVRPGYGVRHSADVSGAERYRRLMAFLSDHPFITRKDYCGITGLLKNKALKDLNMLVDKGYLTTLGQGCHKVYLKADNKQATNQ
ncbi:HU family DNA-binding protein [Bacteroides sp.]|uniref:HU family DNA-binding protein n=1 Tax=Bacteroides sp. TaxID=29523 RepID=UPI003AB6A2A6